MKKLFISLGLALGLLGTTTIHAQPFVLPTAAYQVKTQAGTFTDISTAEGVVKLGADLPAKTDLKDMMIMERNAADDNSPSPAFVVNNQAQRTTRSEIGFPIGFDFKLSGKTMTHFVISALGGIFFSEEAGHYSYQSSNAAGGENCIAAHPILTLKGKTTPTMPAAGAKVITNKTGQPIAYYLLSGAEGSRVLTVQHHYLVTSDSASDEADRDEWIFQFKCYEGTNNIEFIVGKLESAHAIGTTPIHKMLLGLTENGYTTTQDILGKQHMNIVTEPTGLLHHLFFSQTAAASNAKGWDSITLLGKASATGNVNVNQLIIKENVPQSGHTISLIYPNSCPETIEKYSEKDFVISNESLNSATYTAKIALNPESFQNYLETLKSGTIVAVLSTDKDPKYTLERGTYYGKGAKLADGSEVLLNSFYKFAKVTKPAAGQPNFKAGTTPLAITANNLKTSTTYYIHLYRMDYLCADAPVYSELCHSLSFATAMDAPQSLTAGIPTLNSVDLTVTPDGNSEVILLKSNTLKDLPVNLSGRPAKGDSIKIGKDSAAIKAVVVDIVKQGTYTVPLAEDEGCYFAAYSINRTGEEYAFSQKYLAVSVRAAYNGMPGLIDFSQFDYQIPDNVRDPGFEIIHKTTFRDLPFGWTREIQVPLEKSGNTFGLGKPGYTPALPTYLFAMCSDRWLDVVTPAFVCDQNIVLVTYNVDIFKTGDDGIYHLDKPLPEDSIRLEYAIEDGEWQTGILYTGATLPTLTPEGFYPLEFTIKDQDIKGKRLRIRYNYYSEGDRLFNVIGSVNIIEGKPCEKPLALCMVDSLMSNTEIAVSWTDNNYPLAESYTVFYKEVSDETDNWKSVRAKSTPAMIPELNTTTAYRVEVAANCGKDGSSYNSYSADFTTLHAFPFSDDMKQEPDYVDDNGRTRSGSDAFSRGFTTATGTLEGRKNLILSITPAEATAVKAGSKIMLYVTSDSTTGITISYNLYKKGETVPSTFPTKDTAIQHKVEASSVEITVSEEMTVFARASLKGISNPSNTVKVKFTIDENAPDLTLTQTPADLTPAATLAEADPADGSAWNSNASYTKVADNRTPQSVGLRESVKTGWLLSPRIFIEKFDMNFPLNIKFKANSAMEVEQDGKKTWVKGQIPEKYTNTKLYVLLSRNGEFSIDDTIASIPVSGATIADKEFSFDIPGVEGIAQVALYFSNPKANPNAENDPMMLFEIYDFSFGYVGTPCFPLTNLKRSNTTTDEATFSWKGNSTEYMIYWAPNSAETYTDSAKTTEPSYTLTGLTDYTQYKVMITGQCDGEPAARNLTATFMTLQECHAPLNFEITDVTATGATFISATDQPNFMSKRLVYVTPENGGETLVLEQLADTLTVTEKFEELTAYVAQTQAICGTDSSAMSERKTFTTLESVVVKDSFELVLNVTPEKAGTVTGAGRYEEGTEVTIKATAAANYDFVAWMKEADTISKEATYRFNMPAEALTYTALFVEKQSNEDLLRAAFDVATKNGQLLIRNLKGLTVEEVIVYGLTGKKINHFTPNSREDLILPVDAGNALLLVRIATEQGVTVYKVYLH